MQFRKCIAPSEPNELRALSCVCGSHAAAEVLTRHRGARNQRRPAIATDAGCAGGRRSSVKMSTGIKRGGEGGCGVRGRSRAKAKDRIDIDDSKITRYRKWEINYLSTQTKPRAKAGLIVRGT
ncbi:hypothetical protein EVAR_81753_1 [Eumeta japonica]|uniref:Uncharacterized protein n=1 Tax=Eumeta variegata TaxID=151549 RepID=A0A4C1UIS2_EUMVA|nr:hypothetical protein EVAR_81753_1 [Eumeta japonica]